MKVGDLVMHSKDLGIVLHIFDNGSACIHLEGGEYQVNNDDLEVLNESRRLGKTPTGYVKCQ